MTDNNNGITQLEKHDTFDEWRIKINEKLKLVSDPGKFERLEESAVTAAADAQESATNAENSATSAGQLATGASESAELSKNWAINMSGLVDGEDYSSKYYSNQSKDFSEASETSATNSESSAVRAKTSEDNALASEQAAKTSETNAKNSATASANSASASAASASAASTSETNAAASESVASSKATAASASATTASDKATIATNKASEASTSATAAANSASEAEASATTATNAADTAVSAASSAGGYEGNSLFYSQESERFANAASIAAATSSGIWRPTLTSLQNVTDQPTNTMGVVYANANPSQNGWYIWDGNAWVKTDLQPTQKSQLGEYNPTAIYVDNFDNITMSGTYRGAVPWVEGGTQYVTVEHYQEREGGRRYQFAYLGLADNTIAIRFRYFQASSQRWGEWRQIIDDKELDRLKNNIGEFNPTAKTVDNFDNITESGIYKGAVPWVEGGTQTVTVSHFQEGNGGRRHQFAYHGLADNTIAIRFRYYQASSESWGEWLQIIDDKELDRLKKELDYLGQRCSYLVYLPEYKGVVNKQERITTAALKDFLLDIKILNATEGKLYKFENIRYSPSNASGYTHDLRIRIQATDKEVLDFVRIAEYNVKIDMNKGIQTFTVKDTSSRAIEFTVDASFLSEDSNSSYSFDVPSGYRYTWYINPKNYIYHTNALSYTQIPSNNISPDDTALTFSDIFDSDPGENLLRGLNSPNRSHENGLVRSNIPARATFIFPRFDTNPGGMQVYETYPNVTRLNISSIDTTTIAGNLTTQLFVPNRVSAYGIRRFHLLNPEPIHANVHGFLEFLIRVPDESTREVYTASIYTPGGIFAAMINSQQHIGVSSILGRDEPKQLDVSAILGDTFYMNDTTPELVEEWLSGYWQKVYIPLSGVASFYNGRTYTFSIYRKHVSGTPTTENTIRNTDLIMLNASFSFYYDASPKINHRYHHLLELAK